MKITIQQGDMYRLGEHVIACGNSLDPSFVSKVIGDRKIRCILCDPPFGVAYVEGKRDFNKLGVDVDKPISSRLMRSILFSPRHGSSRWYRILNHTTLATYSTGT
jgi:hypothetical protein